MTSIKKRLDFLEANDKYRNNQINELITKPAYKKNLVECNKCGVIINRMKTTVEVEIQEYKNMDNKPQWRDEIKKYYCKNCKV